MPAHAPGADMTFGIRPENVRLGEAHGAGVATLAGTVTQIEALGAETIITAQLPNVDAPLTARVAGDGGPGVGDRVGFAVDLGAAHVFAPDGRAVTPIQS